MTPIHSLAPKLHLGAYHHPKLSFEDNGFPKCNLGKSVRLAFRKI